MRRVAHSIDEKSPHAPRPTSPQGDQTQTRPPYQTGLVLQCNGITMGIPSQMALVRERKNNLSLSTVVPPFLSDSDGVSTTVEKEYIPREISMRMHRCTKKKTVPEPVVNDRMTWDRIWGSIYSSHFLNHRRHTTHQRKSGWVRHSERRSNLRELSRAFSFVGSPKSSRVLEFLPSTTALWGDRFLLDSLSATFAASLTTLLLFHWTHTDRRRSSRRHRSKRGCRRASSIGETTCLVGMSFLLVLPIVLCMAGTIHWMLLLDVCIRYYLAKAVSADGLAQLFPISFTGGVSDASIGNSLSQRLHSAFQLIVVVLIWLRVCDAGQALPMAWSLNIGLPDHIVLQDKTTQIIADRRSTPLALPFSRRTRRVSSSSSSEEHSSRVDEYSLSPNLLDHGRIPTPPFRQPKIDYFSGRVEKLQSHAISHIDQNSSPVYTTRTPHLAGKPYQHNNNTLHAQLKELMLSVNYY